MERIIKQRVDRQYMSYHSYHYDRYNNAVGRSFVSRCSTFREKTYLQVGGYSLPGVRTSPGTLSALADISEEQRTISQLRTTLDAQSRETERLQRELRGDSATTSTTTRGRYGSLLSSLDITPPPASHNSNKPLPTQHLRHHTTPSSTYTSNFQHNSDIPTQSHLERQVKQSQEEIFDLRTKLREALRISEEQRNQYRKTVDELQTQLREAVLQKDHASESKQREVTTHESTITRLQGTISQLEEANRVQEETLLGMNAKLETMQRDQYLHDTLAAQIRSLLLDREHKRGRAYFDSEPITRQNVSMLAHSLERCVHELVTDLEKYEHKVKELETELDSSRGSNQDRLQYLTKDHQEKLSQLSEEHEKELNAAVDRSVHARKQVSTLQEQLAMVQQQSEQQIRMKDEQIRELEARMERLTRDLDLDSTKWKDKREALENALDHIQKEIVVAKNERNDAVHKMAITEGKFDELQQTITRLEGELGTEREQVRSLLTQDKESRFQAENLATSLQQKTKEVEMLQQALSTMKHEANNQLQHTVANVEREEKEKTAEQVQLLQKRMAETLEMSQSLRLELEVLKTEHKHLVERHGTLQEDYDSARTKLDTLQSNKDQSSVVMQERLSDIERLTQEKEYYFKMLGDKDKEVTGLNSEVNKLSIQLEEKEKTYDSMKQQNNNLLNLVENIGKENTELKSNKETSSQNLNEKIIESEELKHSRDNIIKKLKVREKYAKDLEEDNMKMADALREKKEEIEALKKEKDESYKDLQEVSLHLAQLQEEKEHLSQEAKAKEASLKKDINKLSSKYKATEHDLKLSQKALKTHREMDGKAVKIAGKMQKEVTEKRGQIDSLQSKVRWMEEKLENTLKERRILKEENSKLSAGLSKSAQQTERLTTEIESSGKKNSELRDRLSKLENALEKAAVKNANSQAQVEQYEQDIARLKLKHRLDLKEMERSGQLNKLSPQVYESLKPPTKSYGSVHPGVVSSSPVDVLPTSQVMNSAYPGSAGLGPSPLTIGVGPVTVSKAQQNAVNSNEQNSAPISQKSEQIDSQKAPPENGVGQELRSLLEEMRSLVYGQKQQQSQQQQQQQQQQPLHDKLANHYFASPQVSTDFDLSYGEVLSPEPVRKSQPRPTRTRSSRGPHRVVSSAVRRKGPFRMTSSPVRPSPAKSLASLPDTSNVDDLTSDIMMEDFKMDNGRADEGPDDLGKLDPQTRALCQRLENKMQSLTRMGSNLQKENKELQALMKDQDVKINQVRQNEKHIKK